MVSWIVLRASWRNGVTVSGARKSTFKKLTNFISILSIFLALVASFQGETINSNDDNHVSPEKFESLKHRINQEKSEKIKPIPEHVGMGKLSCFSCSPPDCRNATICHNAVRCQVNSFWFHEYS